MKPWRRERGQSTVEFALILPIVLVVFLGFVQVAAVAYAQLGVSHVAREAARSLAADSTADIGQLAQSGPFGNSEDLIIEVLFETSSSTRRETVFVSVSYDVEPIIGLFEPFSSSFRVQADIQMLVE